jgi:hypothetical protein
MGTKASCVAALVLKRGKSVTPPDMLEAINESKPQTYERWNFQRFVDGKMDMYIPLATIDRYWESD